MEQNNLNGLKKWHFDKGEQFDEMVFNDLAQALDKQKKNAPKMLIAFFVSVAVMFTIGWWCSSFIGGFTGNMMSVFIYVFTTPAAMVIASKLTQDESFKIVRSSMEKLNINNKDIAAARKHLKNGTYAWQPKK